MKKFNLILLFGILYLTLGIIPSASAQKKFVHPGIPFTQADLNQLKANITKEPWLSGYNALKNDPKSKLSYNPQGPFPTVSRAPNLNNIQWKSDMQAIHNLTFMYVFTGDPAYAKKATDLLNAWAVTNTSWQGNENMLDIGDYVPYFVTAADILKSTYPGWTETNTTNVRNYFANVIYPTSWVPNPLRDCNKGAIQLMIGLSVAAFLDDETKWNQSIEVYRMDAGAALRNSTPSGQVGDTGRDDHWFVQAFSLAWGAEVAYKQGVDMFAEMDNRLLAIGELYNHYAIDPSGLTYIPYGGYSVYWSQGWGIPSGARKQHPFNNIIQGAYSVRKGMPTPYTDKMRTLTGENGWSFLYLKSSDNSTATAMSPIVYPSQNVVSAPYLTNIDIGNPGIKGSAAYNAGIWTVKGAGYAPSNSNNFTFCPVKGNAAIVAKIESNSVAGAISGLMIRESLAAGSKFAAINFNPSGPVNLSSSGASASNSGYTHYAVNSAWWLKLERVGNRIFAYHSHDGVTWTNIALFIMTLPEDAYIGFYTSSKNASVLNTAVFSNVAINNNFAAGSPDITSNKFASGVVGTPFSYIIIPAAGPAAYTASGLPAGLSLDAVTGIISGTPTTRGTSVVIVEASNGKGISKTAVIIDITTNKAPGAITKLTAAAFNSSIKLEWPGGPNITSYTVSRASASGGPYTVIQNNLTNNFFTDPSPAYEINNYYIVTAYNGNLASGISNEVFASIPPEVPSQPAITSANGQVTLTWKAAVGAKEYNIKRAVTMGGPYTVIGTVPATNYTDKALVNGVGYYYVISSVGATKESENSDEAFGAAGSSIRTWSSNPSSQNWNQNANWVEAVIPSSPAVLNFNTSTNTNLYNDIINLEISRILFEPDAYPYTIEGNSISLKNDIVNNSLNSQSLTNAVTINSQAIINPHTDDLRLSGIISGTGGLVKTGEKFLFISGINTYEGNTVINGPSGGWPPQRAVAIAGHGTGLEGKPDSGPLGKGKIILNGGTLLSEGGDATLYNDIEVTDGVRSYMYETSYAINLRGRLIGKGTLEHDGNTYAGLHLFGDNSLFAGTFFSKQRSGNQRVRFEVPQSGSANAVWHLDANGVDCHSIQFKTGTLHFGALTGRGYLRNNAGGSPYISIGALNTDSYFGGTFANSLNVEKVGTGKLVFTGNHAYWGITTVKKGKFQLNNDPATGAFISPITVVEGALGGTGVSQSSAVIGSGSGSGAKLEPGNDAIGTLTLSSLTLNADAVYSVELDLKTEASDKMITGSVILADSPSLEIIGNTGTLLYGTTYTIIDNKGDGTVTGIFKNLPEMSLLRVGDYSFRITYKGGTGNDVQLLDSRIFAGNADETTDAEDEIIVYPNPAATMLMVKVNTVKNNTILELYNSLGMKVKSQPLTSKTETIPCENLSAGIYFLKVISANKIIVKKIIRE